MHSLGYTMVIRKLGEKEFSSQSENSIVQL